MLRLQTFWLSALVATGVGVVLCLLPLVSVHGVDSALILGIAVPPFIAAFGAAYGRRFAATQRGIDLHLNAIGGGLIVIGIPVLLLGLNAFRVRQCAPLEGLAFMALGPILGSVLAAVVGVCCALVTRGSIWSVWLAVAFTIGSLVSGLLTFWSTPAIYLYGAFAGYFPGTLYDVSVSIPTPYLTYRGCTAIVILALVLLSEALWNRDGQRLDIAAGLRDRTGMVAIGLAGLVFGAGAYMFGDQLRHRGSEAEVAKALGKTEEGEHCIVHAPRELPQAVARRLVDDCDFQVERVSEKLQLPATEKVTAYFFRNAGEKKALMGAGRTLIAKPWRNEVYLQMREWPHPVLAHELTHVIAGNAARAPFRVSATWGGWLPNPGLIEGTAVAVAWDIRGELDPDRWAKIMLDSGQLPSASDLMGLKFASLPARKAYAAAGSLVRVLISTRGLQGWHEAYNTGVVPDLKQLEALWHAHLEKVDVTDNERAIAEEALARKSIFGRVCPRKVAQLTGDLRKDLAAKDDVRARETCESILKIDPTQWNARAALVGVLARAGDEGAAETEIDSLRDQYKAPEPLVAAAVESIADAAWLAHESERASELYAQVLSLPQADNQARGREVKSLALQSSEPEQLLVQELLLRRPSGVVAVHVARELNRLREDGLGPYLEARQLVGQRRYDLARPLLELAAARTLPTQRLTNENLRLLGIAHFVTGDLEDSEQAWDAYGKLGVTEALVAAEWRERIAFANRRIRDD